LLENAGIGTRDPIEVLGRLRLDARRAKFSSLCGVLAYAIGIASRGCRLDGYSSVVLCCLRGSILLCTHRCSAKREGCCANCGDQSRAIHITPYGIRVVRFEDTGGYFVICLVFRKIKSRLQRRLGQTFDPVIRPDEEFDHSIGLMFQIDRHLTDTAFLVCGEIESVALIDVR